MIYYYKKDDNKVDRLEEYTAGCWISLIKPQADEVKTISLQCNIEEEDILAVIDVDERSRIECKSDYTMVIVNVPIMLENSASELYDTIPLSIFVTKNNVITVCRESTAVLSDFVNGKVRGFDTAMKSRFVFQILYRTASQFLLYLRSIDKRSDEIEVKLHRSTRNRELTELLKLQKSLVYFTTALSSNETVLEKLLRSDHIKKYPDDSELLEDVIIENKQAIEMAHIYSGVLNGMTGTIASVISNNMNVVMKALAIITIVMSVPTMIFSAYGMNVQGLPLADNPTGLLFIILISAGLSIAAAIALITLRWFK